MHPPPDSPLGRLLAAPMATGTLVWIGLRETRAGSILTPTVAQLTAKRGIEGDHFHSWRDGARQVTVIGQEDLDAIASFLGKSGVMPQLLRRNLVTRGINPLALKNRRFRIGNCILEFTGDCAPCSQMEASLGPGGYNAVRGHGGITARIIEGGEIRLGDIVERIDIDAQ